MESRHRVVVYQLDEQNQWIEIGMGYCECESLVNTIDDKEEQESKIKVHSEVDNNVFFTVTIHSDTIYRQEQDTIIAWSDPDGNDYALSFEDNIGCERYWNIIHNIQTSTLVYDQSHPDIDMISNDHSISIGYDTMAESSPLQIQQLELPIIALNTLQELDDLIAHSSTSWVSRISIGRSLLSNNNINQLFDLFDAAESLDSLSDLHLLYNIFKKIVLLHHADIFEHLLKQDNIIRFVSILEYNPNSTTKPDYRSFINEKAILREIVPINQDIKEHIHLVFRAQYLRDIVLIKILNDESFMLITNIIRSNYQQILDKLEHDPTMLSSIMELSQNCQDPSTQSHIILFIKEFLMMLKTLSKDSILARLFPLNALLNFIHIILSEKSDIETIQISTELLVSLLTSFVVDIRDYILESKSNDDDDVKLLPCIIHHLKSNAFGIRSHCAHILKSLLTIQPNTMKNDDFLNMFYTKYVHDLFSPLYELQVETKNPRLDNSQADLIYNICTLLSCFLLQHTYRIKYIVLGGTILQNVLFLVHSNEKYLILTAIRIFRTIVGLSDEFYNRYIIKHRLFAFIIPLLVHCHKNNMIASALLELFEFIQTRNIRLLIDYLMENHLDVIQSLKHSNTFKKLLTRHEDHTIDSKTTSFISSSDILMKDVEPKIRAWSNVDQDEEAYFSSEDENSVQNEDEKLHSLNSVEFIKEANPLAYEMRDNIEPEMKIQPSSLDLTNLNPILSCDSIVSGYMDDDIHPSKKSRSDE